MRKFQTKNNSTPTSTLIAQKKGQNEITNWPPFFTHHFTHLSTMRPEVENTSFIIFVFFLLDKDILEEGEDGIIAKSPRAVSSPGYF